MASNDQDYMVWTMQVVANTAATADIEYKCLKQEAANKVELEKELEKEIPVSSLVQVLISEATDLKNLVSDWQTASTYIYWRSICLQSKMYIGWSPYFWPDQFWLYR